MFGDNPPRMPRPEDYGVRDYGAELERRSKDALAQVQAMNARRDARIERLERLLEGIAEKLGVTLPPPVE